MVKFVAQPEARVTDAETFADAVQDFARIAVVLPCKSEDVPDELLGLTLVQASRACCSACGCRKAELARRVGWHLPQVDRVLDVNHHSRLDQMDAALGAIGLRLEVTSKEAA